GTLPQRVSIKSSDPHADPFEGNWIRSPAWSPGPMVSMEQPIVNRVFRWFLRIDHSPLNGIQTVYDVRHRFLGRVRHECSFQRAIRVDCDCAFWAIRTWIDLWH